jgi:hypothetical protein
VGESHPTIRQFREEIETFRKRFAGRRSKAMATARERDLYRADTPQDVTSTRAESQRHGKVTADAGISNRSAAGQATAPSDRRPRSPPHAQASSYPYRNPGAYAVDNSS